MSAVCTNRNAIGRSPATNINGVWLRLDRRISSQAWLTVVTANWLATAGCGAPRLSNADDVDEANSGMAASKEHHSESGRAGFVKSFGHRQAYESLRGRNPRATGDSYGDFGFRSLPRRVRWFAECTLAFGETTRELRRAICSRLDGFGAALDTIAPTAATRPAFAGFCRKLRWAW